MPNTLCTAAHSNLGVAYKGTKPPQIEKALKHFRKAVRIQPAFSTAMYNLAQVLPRSGYTV
jgi:hypothetical protein